MSLIGLILIALLVYGVITIVRKIVGKQSFGSRGLLVVTLVGALLGGIMGVLLADFVIPERDQETLGLTLVVSMVLSGAISLYYFARRRNLSISNINHSKDKHQTSREDELSTEGSKQQTWHFEPAPSHNHKRRIFISYRRRDSSDITGRIYDRLAQHFGADAVFKDVDSVPLGVDFRQYTEGMLENCQIVLVVIGDQWVTTEEASGTRRLENSKDHVRIEIEVALKRRIPVIPVLVRGAEIPLEDDLPTTLKELSYRNAINVRPDPDFHNDMARLIKGITVHLEA